MAEIRKNISGSNYFGETPSDNKTQTENTQTQTFRPVYDEFMYEPLGFENNPTDIPLYDEPPKTKKHKANVSEVLTIILFVLLLLSSAGLSVWGIVNDVTNSQLVIDELKIKQNVVLYQDAKPEGANDLQNFVDENGKYTVEGVASAVRSSIVEIYTYADSKRSTLLGTGSGIVLSSDGYIATNAHVLKENGYHTVHTADGRNYNAKIVGRDVKTDIAVILVNEASLTPAVLGNSDEAIVGEQVIAIGNPAGLSNTVTDGIISAVNRKIRSDSSGFEMNCIQTNADISPGNSGGALVNMYGQVIGITSSKYASSPNSSFEGLGFAITINEAKPIIEELINTGYISGRFRIGIQLIDMSNKAKIEEIEKALGYSIPEDFAGVFIADISQDADIAKTELKVGDFITAINGKSVKTYDELYDTISSMYKAGDKVPATCAKISENGEVSYYNIEFTIMEDKSGNF